MGEKEDKELGVLVNKTQQFTSAGRKDSCLLGCISRFVSYM